MKLLSSFKEYYQRSLFTITPLSKVFNPFYFARKGLYEAIEFFSSELSGSKRILDVGCGKKPYMHLFQNSEYIGLEIDSESNRLNKHADYFYDGHTFPFEDNSFDAVICNQVLEHVFEPSSFLKEINRCLKSDGKFLLTVPFVWDEHEIPYDFARYSSFGLIHLLERENFIVVDHKKSVDDIRVVFQLVLAYVYKVSIAPRRRFLQFLLTPVLVFPVNIIGDLLSWIFPQNQDLYLDNVILAEKGK